jgi:arylsulfatase A-like enzyme
LQRSDYADNTIVVLWSDHGYHLGEKNRFAKQALWDRANRVPLIISMPGQGRGERCARPVGLIDLYPTLVEVCGLPPNPHNEGRSLMPLLSDSAAEWNHAVITTYGRNNHAVQTERYRFYQYENGAMELYDHRQDPQEWTNLAATGEHRSLIRRLQRHLPGTNAPPSEHNKYPTNRYFQRRY